MKFTYGLVTALLVAATGAYIPPEDLEDGIYLVGRGTGDSAKFRRDFGAPVRIGDIVKPNDARGFFPNTTSPQESSVERRDDFIHHERKHYCEDYNTMTLADYTIAMNSFTTRCENQKVPARSKSGAICNGSQGILFAKAGSAIVYHCNVSCQQQNCGGGHISPFESWADKTCGRLKGAWFYSSWDFTMGRSTWGSEFCGKTI
ncbi:uncharacterized protein GGS22DRAFT_158422 [Annulohypoxylon maeteangense]|uniref:uncharacterized protein n=1 Tax=Annulohypoxylon maeteangense TaxID=1927788 RepID=UPI0020072025|nr:uncharacterized protein GGS22DRAFT_158422 [Annulohypoxylon maeteangense]KAI0886675.1 hypothetical protein GGS22DRAFT_158422 [Annulohypoxylon maeteangense]